MIPVSSVSNANSTFPTGVTILLVCSDQILLADFAEKGVNGAYTPVPFVVCQNGILLSFKLSIGER